MNLEPGTSVSVTLLSVRVTAYVVINIAEHRRRDADGVGAIINPVLLDRLLDLPAGVPVNDPVMWAEMADQPPGILERIAGGTKIIRRLESPLTISYVVVNAAADGEGRAVQDASLFAGFTRRWMMAARSRVTDSAMLEAKLCGVGVLDLDRQVLLTAEKAINPTVDGWSWLLEEKSYQCWLNQRPGNRATGSPAPATDRASGIQEG